MTRPKLAHVKYVRAKGQLYAYFNTGRKKGSKPVYTKLPKPGAIGFFDSYASCLAARNRTAPLADTFEKLSDDYQNSREFAALAEGSQDAYRIYLRLAVSLLGKAPADDVTRGDIQEILDTVQWGAGKRNLFVAVIGSAYKWGRARNRVTAWPTREMGVLATGEHLKWPQDVLDAALAADDSLTRIAVALLFYTGQRIGDVCALRWSDLKGGQLRIVQQKTGKALTIRLHADLRAELDRYPKRGVTVLTNTVGRKLSPDKLRDRLKAFCAGQGHPKLVPHGLRKNAVIALLTTGCSVAETAAVTGQTYALVEYYARQIDQEHLAGAAILKLEQNGPRKTVRKTAPESGGNA